MPRLVNCIKNCCFSLLLIAFISAVCSLFVWQAEVYQSTIDEQVRLMKLDISAMKKENHLMEIKLNEQYGKHEDLKEEFRYLLKQAKWSVSGKQDEQLEDREENEVKDTEKDTVDTFNHPELQDDSDNKDEEKEREKRSENGELEKINEKREIEKDVKKDEDAALQNALNALHNNDFDLSKRTHILIVSEKFGGGDVLGSLMSHDENLFFLPSVSNVVKSVADFNKISHCTIPQTLVDYYKTHMGAALTSKSIAKFCPEGKCSEELTTENLESECMSKHIAVLEGSTENWPLKTLDGLSMEVAYVKRDPRAIVSRLLEDKEISDEEVQLFSTQLCTRIKSFSDHSSSSHNIYQVLEYEKLAVSPLTSLSQLYHKLLDTTHIPTINLTKEYKNELYLSVRDWKNKLPTIAVDAVNEECSAVIDKL